MNENYSEYSVSVQPTRESRAKHLAILAVTAAAIVLAFQVHWGFLALVIAGGIR